MNRYWTRIGIGALLVFVLGFSGLTAVRKGKAEVKSLLATASRRLPLQLAHMGFQFDGRRIGKLSGIDVQRSGPGELGAVTLRVALDDNGYLARLADCALTADNLDRMGRQSGFRCAEASELNDLVEMGKVIFQPGDLARPLLLPRGATERWRNSGVRSLDASLATDAAGGVTAQGRFDVANGASAAERGTFSLKADNQGAVISVRDDQGHSLVDFRADQNGVNLNLRDRHGRNLIRLLADSLGAALRARH